MADAAAVELYDTRSSRGQHGRLTVWQRWKVDLTLAGIGGAVIGPEMAPYALGVPQLGQATDFRDATIFPLSGGGLVPLTTRVRMVGFDTEITNSPNFVFVKCEFDNFTLNKLKTIQTVASTETWPIFQKIPYGADVAAGALQTRFIWSLQTRNSPTSRTVMQVNMTVKTLTQTLIDQLTAQAGKIHKFSSSFASGSAGQYWLFEGANCQQMGEATSGADTAPVWKISYQWHNDPGFHLPDEEVVPPGTPSGQQNPLFKASSDGGRGGPYNPAYAVLPHRISLNNPDLRTRAQISAAGDAFNAGFFRWRFPFEQYIKIPQVELDLGNPDPNGLTRPDLQIMPRTNEDLLGWTTLPGNPIE